MRGTAFGFFNLVSGVAMLLAGLLWDRFGASHTFVAGGALALVAMVLVVLRERTRSVRN